MNRKLFEAKVRASRFFTIEEIEEIFEYKNWRERYSRLSRNTAAGILQIVYDGEDGIELDNQIEFAQNGLYCEWAYLIDLDNNSFEVYRGERNYINQEYCGLQCDWQLVKVNQWNLNNLPSEEDFLFSNFEKG